VLISQLAGQSLYRRFLRAGVQIAEYQPQILHAKLIIADDAVYVGSANLDQRSLNINYELMIRFHHKEMAEQARAVFARTLTHCRQITLEEWRRSRTLWRRLKQRWAYWLLVRIDPYLAGRQWRNLPIRDWAGTLALPALSRQGDQVPLHAHRLDRKLQPLVNLMQVAADAQQENAAP